MTSNKNLKINYEYRPSKQIERKIIVELLQILLNSKIKNYKYIGFGSVYFYDFKLFHKQLHLENMTSLEKENKLINRCKFNKPYSFINLIHSTISDHLEQLNWDEMHLFWLDYEDPINEEKLETLEYISANCNEGEILFISIPINSNNNGEGLKSFIEIFSKHLTIDEKKPVYLNKHFREVLERMIDESIIQGLRSDKDLSHIKICNITYRDGIKMYTYGALIVNEKNKIKFSEIIKKNKILKKISEYIHIECPLLTIKEKLLIDSKLTKRKKIPKRIVKELNLSLKDVTNYEEFYKYYPTYVETLY